MGVTPAEFYDESRVAIVPMSFCFPGLDKHGSDLPPRLECAALWRDRVFAALPQLELILLVGMYAMKWHLKARCAETMTETVRHWRQIAKLDGSVRQIALPDPSWRNNAWVRANDWFEAELLGEVRAEVRRALDTEGHGGSVTGGGEARELS